MNISIAIVDNNRLYLERLVEVLQEYEDLSVSIYTNSELLEKSLEVKKYDSVLFNPDICDEKIRFSNVKLPICLYSNEEKNAVLYSEYNKVIKYQRISKLYKDIIKLYADKAGDIPDFDNIHRSKVVAVYSPIGGSGKTTVALAMASMISSLGENVLYLNAEQLDSSSCLNEHTVDEDGITILLEALEENINFELKLKGIVKKGIDGFSYIEGFERIVDYNSVSNEEAEAVLEKIIRYGNYGVVIVDMGSCLNEIGKAVFEKADRIIIVEKPGDVSMKKIEMFSKQALTLEYMDKMCKIRNFADNFANQEDALDVPVVGKITNLGNLSLKNTMQKITSKAVINVDAVFRKNFK